MKTTDKIQGRVLLGFLIVMIVIVGTFYFQQFNSSESEMTPVSQSVTEEMEVSDVQDKTDETVTVKGKVSLSF